MAAKVLFHIGLPKTGTTYIQSILWANKGRLSEQGVLLPGRSARQQMRASVVVREHPGVVNRAPEVRDAWASVVEQVNAWPGTALISHEFFGGATSEQARAALADLGDAVIHLIVTARDVLTLVTSYWQEYIKHGFDMDLDDFPAKDGEPWDEWGWTTLDLESVLDRWAAHVPHEHVHVLVLPEPDAPRETLWLQFADLIGIDPTDFTTARGRENRSLPLVEAELLRRVSRELRGFTSALDRGVWVRSYLAHGKLVPRDGERFLPSERRVEELRQRASRTIDFLREGGYQVIGDPERLRVPDDLPTSRHPDSVTDAELLDAATQTMALMMSDLRTFRRQVTELKAAQPPPPEPPVERVGLLRRLRSWGSSALRGGSRHG